MLGAACAVVLARHAPFAQPLLRRLFRSLFTANASLGYWVNSPLLTERIFVD